MLLHLSAQSTGEIDCSPSDPSNSMVLPTLISSEPVITSYSDICIRISRSETSANSYKLPRTEKPRRGRDSNPRQKLPPVTP